jgi:hypothetical protein
MKTLFAESRRFGAMGLLLVWGTVFSTGCEDVGGSLLSANPAVARMAAVSEEEAAKFPVAKRYGWAYSRFGIEANDVKRGIRWRNALKVKNASERAARFLEIMETLLDSESDRRAARESTEAYRALGEALSGGRWFRSGMDAADALRRDVEARLATARVALKEDPPKTIPPSGPTPPSLGGGPWTVSAKRVVVEETTGGTRKRYFLILEDGQGAQVEQEVEEGAFSATPVGVAWTADPPPGPGEPGNAENPPEKGEGVRKR